MKHDLLQYLMFSVNIILFRDASWNSIKRRYSLQKQEEFSLAVIHASTESSNSFRTNSENMQFQSHPFFLYQPWIHVYYMFTECPNFQACSKKVG